MKHLLDIKNKDERWDKYVFIGIFCVRKLQYEKYKKKYLEIEELIESGRPVPADLLRETLVMIKDMEHVERRENAIILASEKKLNAKKYVDMVVLYFSDFPEYLFSNEVEVNLKTFDSSLIFSGLPMEDQYKIVSVKELWTFEKMITNAVNQYFFLKHIGEFDLNFTIKVLYRSIDDYCKKCFVDPDKQYTRYMRRVVAAYTAFSVGKRIFDKNRKEFNNKDLSNIAHNALRAKG